MKNMKNICDILTKHFCFYQILTYNANRTRCYIQFNFHSTKPSNKRKHESNNFLDTNYKSIYYFEDGLRKVYPYYQDFNTYCKGRWVNKNIVDVFCSEYALYPRQVIENRILGGFVEVNNKVVNAKYILKRGDLLSYVNHRHELSVLACPIEILYEDEDLLVVNKPPSIPVHPCGLYSNNSVLFILANEYDRNNLHVLHRLDRLTSGVLLLAKSQKKSREFQKEMENGNIKKEYVCRVEGNFPDDAILCGAPVKMFYDGVGACFVHPLGKTAMTEFKKLSYNGKSSVVLCKPYTGRTHQIRVHLQYLGYPIINDPIYNSFVFGSFKGKCGFQGKSIEELMSDLRKEHSSEWGFENVSDTKISNEKNFLRFSIFKEFYFNKDLPTYRKDCSRILMDENCYFCNNTVTHDPEQSSLGMFLHAYKYEANSWRFESNLPFWAHDDWNIA